MLARVCVPYLQDIFGCAFDSETRCELCGARDKTPRSTELEARLSDLKRNLDAFAYFI